MNKIKFLVGIAILFGLWAAGFGDVTVDPVFSPADLRVINQFEPRDSNYYDHISLSGCELTTMEVGKPLLPVKFCKIVLFCKVLVGIDTKDIFSTMCLGLSIY